MKRFLMVCVALILLMTAALPTSAKAGVDNLTLAGASSGSDVIAAAPAVIYNDEGMCLVATDSSVYADGAGCYTVALNGQSVEMAFQEEGVAGLALFTLDRSYLTQPGVLDLAQSVQPEEELTYYFIYVEEGTTAVLKGSAKITEKDGGQIFDITLPDGVEKAEIRYPAIAVNQAGELAIIDGAHGIVPLCSIEEGGTPKQAPDEPVLNPTAAPSRKVGSNLPAETIVVIVVAAVIVVAGIVIFFKKKNPDSSIPAQSPIQPVDPGQFAPQVPDVLERIEPVEIKPQFPSPQRKTSVLYLCCEGGAMDGRRYAMSTATILIGRDPSCNIRYPADAKGVSRRHCEIFWKNGVLNIMDLGSTAGTFIRGKGQIPANAPMAVSAGDTFYLGEKRNAFVIRMGDEE